MQFLAFIGENPFDNSFAGTSDYKILHLSISWRNAYITTILVLIFEFAFLSSNNNALIIL